LTLRDVMERSRGYFKPSVLGGYERGERRVPLDRFWMLASLYGKPADRLLAEALQRLHPMGRREVVIDLNRLAFIPDSEGRSIAEFIHVVRTERGDYLSGVITLRSGDVEVLALRSGKSTESLLRSLGPALVRKAKRQAETAVLSG
jgi:hypothetical protein